MTKSEIEEVWRSTPLQFWGHVACWDEDGHARPGAALDTKPSEAVMAFRKLIKKINQKRTLKHDVSG